MKDDHGEMKAGQEQAKAEMKTSRERLKVRPKNDGGRNKFN
jgi:hypothetical protein